MGSQDIECDRMATLLGTFKLNFAFYLVCCVYLFSILACIFIHISHA